MKYSETIAVPAIAMNVASNVEGLKDICHGLAYEAGWWIHKPTHINLKDAINTPEGSVAKLIGDLVVSQKLLLSHSELSEAMEGHRKGLMDDKLPHRPMLEVELADAVIRIMDLAGAMNLDIGGAIVEKLQFNTQRPDHKPENREKDGGKAY